MQVGAIEELGAQRLVHGKVNGADVTIALPSHGELSDRLRLNAAPEALHRFDDKSGKRLD